MKNWLFMLSHFLPAFVVPPRRLFQSSEKEVVSSSLTQGDGRDQVTTSSEFRPIAVEGFRHSANTYISLNLASDNRTLYSHTHRAWSVRRNARRGVAGVFVIRDPLSVATSMFNRSRSAEYDLVDMPISAGLLSWIGYHNAVKPYLDRYLVIKFDDLVNGPDLCFKNMSNHLRIPKPEFLSDRYINRFPGKRIEPKLGPIDRHWLHVAQSLYAEIVNNPATLRGVD